MKRTFGFILSGLFALTIIGGIALIVLATIEVTLPESYFVTGFILSFGGALIADEIIPLFFEEWDDNEDEENE